MFMWWPVWWWVSAICFHICSICHNNNRTIPARPLISNCSVNSTTIEISCVVKYVVLAVILDLILFLKEISSLRVADRNANAYLFTNCAVIPSSVFSQSMCISWLSWCRSVCPQPNMFTGAQLKRWTDTHESWIQTVAVHGYYLRHGI